MCDGCEVNEKYYRHTISEPTKDDLLLESLCIPTQTEIRSQLGSKLADVFFENLSSEGRIILGLQPPLTGPESVWVNPTSRLRNKVRCKPLPEPHVLHKKAASHKAILELGQQYIDSLHLKLKKEIQVALASQAAEFEEECNKRLVAALEEARLEADEQCKHVVGTLMEHFDRCFAEVVETNKLRMRKECQFRVQEERAELASYMLAQLQDEVRKRDLELCSDFHDTLNGELNALARRYVNQIDCERKVAREVVEGIIQKYEKMLVDMRSEMEICSFVDVCRAITEERAKCEEESRGKQQEVRKQINLLVDWITDLMNRNKTLEQMATERAMRIEKYTEKMKVLLEEFQKFVNFSLRAHPAHAEFLLSTQKMILRKYHEDTLLHPEEYEEFKNCMTGKAVEGKFEPEVKREDVRKTTPKEKAKAEGPTAEPKRDAEEETKYTFNYHKFKYSLLKNLVKEVKFPPPERKIFSTAGRPCGRRQAESEEEEDKSLSGESAEARKEYREALNLVGENEREHIRPVRTFLQGRMKTITELCKDDPEMVQMILGHPPIAGDVSDVSGLCLPG